MAINFRDILQAVDGDRKGLLAQVVSVNNGEVELLSRSLEGVPTNFTISKDDLAHWKPTGGKALVGPKPKIFEPESEVESHPSASEGSVEQATATDAAPAQSASEPINVEELLEPLPPDVKAVPMTAAPAKSAWDVEEPPQPVKPTLLPKPRKPKPKAAAKQPVQKRNYTALVTNGAGDNTVISYALREGLDPKRYVGVVLTKAVRLLPDVKPFTVTDIKEGPPPAAA